jgi:penicillin-binding protein 1C
MRWWRTKWLVLALPLLLAVAMLTLDYCFPLDLTRGSTLSPELLDASGRVLNLRAATDGAIRLVTMPDAVGSDVVPLLLAREDHRFWSMPGVDVLALVRAAVQLLHSGRIVSGGSTITMQVARLLEPHPRTLLGKLHDMLRALQLEAHLSKSEILKLYLTLAPMGGNVEGVRAASLLYFGCEPAALTRSQAALLVSLPQSPSRRRPDRHPEVAWRAASRVLVAADDNAPVVATPVARPNLPVAARYLAQHLNGRTASTIDADLQTSVESLAQREISWLGPDTDVAALVIRNRDRAILGYLGGARFFAPAGQVDMVRRPRSPGSALKPFIYAMAFEQGLATPDTLVDDTALRLGDYGPRDFDRAERGPITAAEALRQSLNRPAVRLLAGVGVARFAGMLRDGGAVLHLPRGGTASAALALGGLGISLYDLAAIYADLDDGGRIMPLRLLTAETPARHSPALFGAQAAGAVAEILRRQPLPPGIVVNAGHPVAYKTGTSYGYRDAWAAAITHRFRVPPAATWPRPSCSIFLLCCHRKIPSAIVHQVIRSRRWHRRFAACHSVLFCGCSSRRPTVS